MFERYNVAPVLSAKLARISARIQARPLQLVAFCLVAIGCPAMGLADLLFSEIQQNAPSWVDETEGEWFEMFNPGPARNLNGYSITDASGGSFTINQSFVADRGDYVLFSRDFNHMPWADFEFDFSLNNSSETLTLRNAAGDVLDEVAWGSATSNSGISLYFNGPDPFADNANLANWSLSTTAYDSGPNGELALGTPGVSNDDGGYFTVPEPAATTWLALTGGFLLSTLRRRGSRYRAFPFRASRG